MARKTKKSRKAKKSRKVTKKTRRGTPSQISAVRKDYETIKRAYKRVGAQLGKLTGIR